MDFKGIPVFHRCFFIPVDNTFFEFVFEFPILTKALGPLNYQILKTIHDELKANAVCVDYDLGGVANGHLGLILTLLDYKKVSPRTPYIRHMMPIAPSEV